MRVWLDVACEMVASMFSPNGCASCEDPVPILTAFCRPCARTLERLEASEPVDHCPLVAPYRYGGALAVAIGRFKYDGRSDLARHLSAVVLTGLRGQAGRVDRVVPVPLHPLRLAQRGYNQAALLGRHVAPALGARFDAGVLCRVVDTEQQAKLDRPARQRNVAGAFRLRRGASVRGERVLVIDDVCTTGATLAECATVLQCAGAASVSGAVIARALA
jgi:ComF family protein